MMWIGTSLGIRASISGARMRLRPRRKSRVSSLPNGLPHAGSWTYLATSAGSRLSHSNPGLSENGLLNPAKMPMKICDCSGAGRGEQIIRQRRAVERAAQNVGVHAVAIPRHVVLRDPGPHAVAKEDALLARVLAADQVAQPLLVLDEVVPCIV